MDDSKKIDKFDIKKFITETKILILDFIKSLLIVFLIASFIFQPSSTPTTSMYPTIKKGDSFILSKFSYGWNLHSLYFGISNSNLWRNIFTFFPQKRILSYGKINYGDVISFRQNSDLETKFLKRAIGLPGDKVQMKNGLLYINGQGMEKKFLRSKTSIKMKGDIEKKRTYYYYEETLPNKKKYLTRYVENYENTPSNNTIEFFIPEGFIFAMGDNRDESDDSRENLGLIPKENIFGKGIICIFAKSKKNKIFTTDLKVLFKSIIYLYKDIKLKRIFKFY